MHKTAACFVCRCRGRGGRGGRWLVVGDRWRLWSLVIVEVVALVIVRVVVVALVIVVVVGRWCVVVVVVDVVC